MRVVFVVLNNYNNQKCIKENIENLKRFNNNDIVVLTDRKNTCYFDDTIEVITIESLIPEYEEYLTRVEKTFREGFSQLTKYRFKVLLEYLKKYDIEKMIHLENDVMVFKNLDELHFHDTNKVLITMDNPNRCIPGIMYIPSFKQLEACMLHWNGNTDMDCWANSFKNNKSKEIIDNLPIMKENSTIKTNHFELLTSPLQAAVAVVQKGIRPILPYNSHPIMMNAMERCWVSEPENRPRFTDLVMDFESHMLGSATKLNLMPSKSFFSRLKSMSTSKKRDRI